MEKINSELVTSEEPPTKKLCIDNKECSEIKIRKRHVALLLAYCGTNYYGMQKNTSFRTVESELLQALYKANLIPFEAINDLHLIHFQRAARTDKGVSAVRQVVSLKLAENYIIQNINYNLPEDIKVFSIKRVTKGFNSKNSCSARTYSYTLPTFALAPETHTEYPINFRINQETIIRVNEILLQFLGTHSFHNFTSKKDMRDPSSKRYILDFVSDEPFVENNVEFITLRIKGQSFMLHQIRKMVGYTIAVMKGIASENIQKQVWSSSKMSIPMAPGLGLVLENVHYDRYNQKFGNDGLHTTLTWDEVSEELGDFKKKYILSNIIQTELLEQSMFHWLQQLKTHEFIFSEDKISNENHEVKKLSDCKVEEVEEAAVEDCCQSKN